MFKAKISLILHDKNSSPKQGIPYDIMNDASLDRLVADIKNRFCYNSLITIDGNVMIIKYKYPLRHPAWDANEKTQTIFVEIFKIEEIPATIPFTEKLS